MLCQSVIWAGFGLTVSVSDWAERTPTKRNIEWSVTPLRFAHMLWSQHPFSVTIVYEQKKKNYRTVIQTFLVTLYNKVSFVNIS